MHQLDTVSIEGKMGCTWITLPNNIIIDTYTAMQEEISRAISQESIRVVLDLSRTNNLFSSGLGLIVRVHKQVCELGGSIYFVNVSRKMRSIFKSINLDKIFTLYATDVEFEIAQEQFKKQASGETPGFAFKARIENALCRIHCSGHMTGEQDLSAINHFTPDAKTVWHVFDLTGLDMVDSAGAVIIIKLIMDIHEHGCKSIAYGLNESVKGLVDLLGMNEYVALFPDERSALASIKKD